MSVFLDPPPSPQAIQGPLGVGPVLVLAPHPDDETAGPGGTIRLHALRGDRIKVIFLTNGLAASEEAKKDPESYQKMREDEALEACRLLGVQETEFWGYPDGARACEADLGVIVPRFLESIRAFRPGVIYVPREEEIHRDHHVAAVAARRALDVLAIDGDPLPRMFGYEIWTAALPSHVVDVSAVHPDKIKACEVYVSQLEHTEIVWAFSGLNMYRSIFLAKGARFGEAYIEYHPRAHTPSDS